MKIEKVTINKKHCEMLKEPDSRCMRTHENNSFHYIQCACKCALNLTVSSRM